MPSDFIFETAVETSEANSAPKATAVTQSKSQFKWKSGADSHEYAEWFQRTSKERFSDKFIFDLSNIANRTNVSDLNTICGCDLPACELWSRSPTRARLPLSTPSRR